MRTKATDSHTISSAAKPPPNFTTTDNTGSLVWAEPLCKPRKNPGQRYCRMRKKYGVDPGVERAFTPDEPDVLDAGDAVEGAIANLLILLVN
jgi:hypothetical protein